tara:strand:+ start:119 stop:304 length:186 start_codon:yes stop_codon:yes gene_type:complete
MEKVKVTLIRDFVMPGKTLLKGTELEITADRVQNFIDTGLIAGKKEKKKAANKIEKAAIDK